MTFHQFLKHSEVHLSDMALKLTLLSSVPQLLHQETTKFLEIFKAIPNKALRWGSPERYSVSDAAY
jgi:hypothetical protein